MRKRACFSALSCIFLTASLLAGEPMQAGTAHAGRTPRIVNGLPTQAFPAAGALIRGAGGVPIDPDNAVSHCSGTLIGCRTFLTAAHCVAGDPDPSHYWIYLQHGGIIPVSAIAHHPEYASGLSGRDVAVLQLGADVIGVEPIPLNGSHDLAAASAGLVGTIVGFGQTYPTSRDFGIKRYGSIQTVDCNPGLTGGEGDDRLVCWDFAIPVGPPGEDSTTCHGDSGGPLFMTFDGVTEVAGVTSAGSSPFCLPYEHAFEASVYDNAPWLEDQLGGDSTAACGGIGPVGDPSVSITERSGTLWNGEPSDSFTIEVGETASLLRVTLNGQNNGTFNPDLYVGQGPGAGPTSYDCRADGSSAFGSCEIVDPEPGIWSVSVVATWGAGEFQTTSAVFDSPPCGSTEPDGDDDGICDRLDLCTNVAHRQDFVPAKHPKLIFGRIGFESPPADDTFVLSAEFRLGPAVSFDGLDPIVRGVRLLVENGAGAARLAASLPAGGYLGKGTRGWTQSHGRTKWTFRDTTGSPVGGITSARVVDRGGLAPGQVKVRIRGTKGTYPVVAGDEPLHATVVLGDHADGLAGACGESAFGPTDCAFDVGRGKLTCSQ